MLQVAPILVMLFLVDARGMEVFGEFDRISTFLIETLMKIGEVMTKTYVVSVQVLEFYHIQLMLKKNN